jgi:hypothetical protein
MTGVASLLLDAAAILGVWTAASVLSVPLLVQCLRLQARVNARRTCELRREEWGEAAGQATR